MPGFIDWLDQSLCVSVREAGHGVVPLQGHVYVSPGDRHLGLGAQGTLDVFDSPPVDFCRPSIDVLFYSLAEHASGPVVGVLLTGMGQDGAEGLLALRRRGHLTLAQDQASSLVFGMPAAALALGAVTHLADPRTMATYLSRVTCLPVTTGGGAA